MLISKLGMMQIGKSTKNYSMRGSMALKRNAATVNTLAAMCASVALMNKCEMGIWKDKEEAEMNKVIWFVLKMFSF